MSVRLILILVLLFIAAEPRDPYPTSNPTVQRFMDYIYYLSRNGRTDLLLPRISETFSFYFGMFHFNREDFIKFIRLYNIRRKGPYDNIKDMGKIWVNETGKMKEYHGIKVVLNTTKYLAKFIVYKLDDQGHWLLGGGHTLKTYHYN